MNSNLAEIFFHLRESVQHDIEYLHRFEQDRLKSVLEFLTFIEGINWHAIQTVKNLEDIWYEKIRPNEVWTNFLLNTTRVVRMHLVSGGLPMDWDRLIEVMVASLDVYGRDPKGRIADEVAINNYLGDVQWKNVFTANPWLVTMMLLASANAVLFAQELSRTHAPAVDKK